MDDFDKDAIAFVLELAANHKYKGDTCSRESASKCFHRLARQLERVAILADLQLQYQEKQDKK